MHLKVCAHTIGVQKQNILLQDNKNAKEITCALISCIWNCLYIQWNNLQMWSTVTRTGETQSEWGKRDGRRETAALQSILQNKWSCAWVSAEDLLFPHITLKAQICIQQTFLNTRWANNCYDSQLFFSVQLL